MRITATAANVSGSVGFTPKSSVAINRLAASEPARPKRQADGCKPRAFGQHLLQHVFALRAERHADADLMRALGDGVGHHAVDSHRGETERERGEGHQQRQIEARLHDRIRKQLVHGADFVDGHVPVDGEHLLADGAGHAGRFEGRAHGKIHGAREGELRQREIRLLAPFDVRAVMLHVADHADNGAPLRAGAVWSWGRY